MPIFAQLIPKRTVHDKFPKAPDITPTFRTAYLEVITVGVRDLKPYGFQVRNLYRLLVNKQFSITKLPPVSCCQAGHPVVSTRCSFHGELGAKGAVDTFLEP